MTKLALPNLAYSLGAVVVLADQVSKYWVLEVFHLPEKGQAQILPFFDLTMVHNTGVSFGLFQSNGGVGRWLLAAFAVIVVVVLGIWVRKARRTWTAISIGLIIGGAVGNLIDRVRFGRVTDFLDFSGPHLDLFGHQLNFPWIFNVADSAINIGIALLLIETLLVPDKKPAPAQA